MKYFDFYQRRSDGGVTHKPVMAKKSKVVSFSEAKTSRDARGGGTRDAQNVVAPFFGDPFADAEAALWSMNVLVLGHPGGVLEREISRISSEFKSLASSNHVAEMIRCAALCDGVEAVFIVDLDLLSAESDAVSVLILLREANPSLAVLIVSTSMSEAAASGAWCPHIADAALELPATGVRLGGAIVTAIQNSAARWE